MKNTKCQDLTAETCVGRNETLKWLVGGGGGRLTIAEMETLENEGTERVTQNFQASCVNMQKIYKKRTTQKKQDMINYYQCTRQ
jgi:hypothetical protein